MIKEEHINISIGYKNLNRYLKLDYYCNVGDIILVKISDLSNSSQTKITAICDKCGEEHTITYQKYNKNIEKYNFYSCKKCSCHQIHPRMKFFEQIFDSKL